MNITAERAQLTQLAAQAACEREALFGVPMQYEGRNFQASAASFKTARKLEESGFAREHDSIIRVNRLTNPRFAPELGKLIVVDAQEFKIDEIIKHPLNPEWRLGLDSAD